MHASHLKCLDMQHRSHTPALIHLLEQKLGLLHATRSLPRTSAHPHAQKQGQLNEELLQA